MTETTATPATPATKPAKHERVGELFSAWDLIRMLIGVVIAETVVVAVLAANGDWWIFIEIVPITAMCAFAVGMSVGKMWSREHE